MSSETESSEAFISTLRVRLETLEKISDRREPLLSEVAALKAQIEGIEKVFTRHELALAELGKTSLEFRVARTLAYLAFGLGVLTFIGNAELWSVTRTEEQVKAITDARDKALKAIGDQVDASIKAQANSPWIDANNFLQSGFSRWTFNNQGSPVALWIFKDASGFVHLRGRVKPSDPKNTIPMLKLPELYRPGQEQRFPVSCSGNSACSVMVDTQGTIWVESPPPIDGNAWINLDSILFRADGA